jgi:hypothetical protein
VLLRRTREALVAGLSLAEARAFAHSGVDIGQLRRLVAEACPLELLRRIVL